MKKNLIVLSGLGLVFAPLFASAQNWAGCSAAGLAGTLQGVLCVVGNILQAAIPVLIALGIVYFVWGVITYVIASDEEAKKAGKNRMIWGIIGLVAIVAMWGLVSLLTTTFNLNNNVNVQLPTVDLH